VLSRYAAAVRLTVLLLTALALRLGFVFAALPAIEPHLSLRFDADNYTAIVQSIWRGEWRDVERGPVYPLFVAACGGSLTAVRLAQALMDCSTVWLVFLMGRRLGGGRTGLIAGWLYAVYPLAWWRVAFMNKEVALTLLLAATVWNCQRPAISGVGWGLVNLCKPSYLLLPLLRRWRPPQRKALLVTLVVMIAVIAPWTVRNYVLTGELLPVATERGGFTAYVTNWWPTRGDWETNKPLWQAELDHIRDAHSNLNPVQLDRLFYRLAMENIVAEPSRTLLMVARKAVMFWFVNASGRVWWAVTLLQLVYLGFALAGAMRRRPPGELLIVILYSWALHTLVIADVRFALPVMPLVCVIAATAFCHEDK
jgi:4-amino-4-deoxy-L-arabinose transferase-like glycosyltransferase